MAGFKNHREVADAELEGRVRDYTWRKTPSGVTGAGLWFDVTLSPGNPGPKFYFDAPPLAAKVMSQSLDGGIYHGPNVSPSQKYLRKITAFTGVATALPMAMHFLDYLLYYPTIDDSTTDPQILDNTATLSRYTDGVGVQVLAVSLAGRTGGQQFNFIYTNSDGVAGRTSQTVFQNNSSVIGCIQNNGAAANASSMAFIGLQAGDSGVRSIQSVTMLGSDVGLFALVLVKPLATSVIRGIDAPVEMDYLIHKNELTRIYDDAFISFICLPNGALSATALIGDLKCIWTA
jgi:hypothetical protein